MQQAIGPIRLWNSLKMYYGGKRSNGILNFYVNIGVIAYCHVIAQECVWVSKNQNGDTD